MDVLLNARSADVSEALRSSGAKRCFAPLYVGRADLVNHRPGLIRRRSRMPVRITLALLLPLGWHAAMAAPTLVADYAGALTSSVAGAPDLSIVGTGTAFASEQVLSDQPSQNVITFTAGSGLALNPMSQILPNLGAYTIAVTARITATSIDGYSKLIDFANGTSQYGVYDAFNTLRFYNYVGAPTIQVVATYGEIVLTRDASATLAGYYDGVLQFSANDSSFQWGVIDASDKLRFFLDDFLGTANEQSGGAVARIRIWTDALSAAEVARLPDTIFTDGFEGM
jgi:hypothetical protein